MSIYTPRKIYIEKAAANFPLTTTILNYYTGIPVEEVPNSKSVIKWALKQPDPIAFGKQYLLLAKQQGRFFKVCPGTKNYICCGYKILNTANNCDLDCTYCILQGYFNNPLMVVYVNLEDLFQELHQLFTRHPDKFYRIGTGELTDSLTLEPVTHYGEQLVDFFKDYPNAIIELKTKSVFIDSLLNRQHRRRAVISWSLNSDECQVAEEPLTPTIEQRLTAAARCQAAGYWLGFHFDPMIYYQGWEAGYQKTVEKLFHFIESRNIAWISLGALRYPPYLDRIIRQRHSTSKIVYGEFISGKDNKFRYFKSIRIDMFRKMVNWIHSIAPEVFVYLCMESDEVWRKAFGWSPGNIAALSKMLDARVK